MEADHFLYPNHLSWGTDYLASDSLKILFRRYTFACFECPYRITTQPVIASTVIVTAIKCFQLWTYIKFSRYSILMLQQRCNAHNQ